MFRLASPCSGSHALRRGFQKNQRRLSSYPRQQSHIPLVPQARRWKVAAGGNGVVVVAVAAAAAAANSSSPSSSSSAAPFRRVSRTPGDSLLSSENFDTIDVSFVTKNSDENKFLVTSRAGSDDVGVGGIDSFDASPSAAAAASVVDVDVGFDDNNDDEFALDDEEDDERAFVLRDDFPDFDDDDDDEGGQGGYFFDDEDEDQGEDDERPAAGPRCVLLAGFAEGEAAAVRALVDAAGFPSAAVLPAEGVHHLSLTVRDAILGGGVSEPDWSIPKKMEEKERGGRRGGGGAPAAPAFALCRAVLFGGMTPREQARVADALEGAGFPRFAVAEASEASEEEEEEEKEGEEGGKGEEKKKRRRRGDWRTRRVGEVLAEAAAEQGLLLSHSSSSSSSSSRRHGKERRRAAVGNSAPSSYASSSSSPSASQSRSPSPPSPTPLVVDALPDVEEMIRRAEREAGGRIKTIEMKGPSSSAAAAGGVGRRRKEGKVEAASPHAPAPAPAPAWHAEASSGGASLLDSLRNNVVSSSSGPSSSSSSLKMEEEASVDGDVDIAAAAAATAAAAAEEDEDEAEEETALLLDAVITGASTAAEAETAGEGEEPSSGEEEDPLASYLAAATAADPGRLARTSNSPTFSASERRSPVRAVHNEEDDKDKKEEAKAAKEAAEAKAAEAAAEAAEAKAAEAAAEAAEAASSTKTSPPDKSAPGGKDEKITIAPVGLEGEEELALHDRLSQELDAKFRAIPPQDRAALRQRMRDEAREPTRDAIVAAVACGLTLDEICAMARSAAEAAREAEVGLGVPWGELAKAELEPSEEELKGASAADEKRERREQRGREHNRD